MSDSDEHNWVEVSIGGHSLWGCKEVCSICSDKRYKMTDANPGFYKGVWYYFNNKKEFPGLIGRSCSEVKMEDVLG